MQIFQLGSHWRSGSRRIRATIIYCVAGIFTLLLAQLSGPTPFFSLIIFMVIPITIVGLPHGALDYDIAKTLPQFQLTSTRILFLLGYVVITALAALFWVIQPTLALCIFLAISMYHFSFDWKTYIGRPETLLMGCLVVSLPAFFHVDTVALLFQQLMLPLEHARLLAKVLAILCLACSIFLAFLIIWRRSSSSMFYAELLLLFVSGALLHPLLFFTVYFCFLHATNHMYDCSDKLGISPVKCYLNTLPVLVATLIGGAATYYIFRSGETGTDLLRWVFIGLFSLTIPHMSLLAYWYRTTSYKQHK